MRNLDFRSGHALAVHFDLHVCISVKRVANLEISVARTLEVTRWRRRNGEWEQCMAVNGLSRTVLVEILLDIPG